MHTTEWRLRRIPLRFRACGLWSGYDCVPRPVVPVADQRARQWCDGQGLQPVPGISCWLPSLRSSVSLYSPGVETRRSGTNRLGSGSVVLLAISAFLCEQPTYKSLAALELDLLVVELLRDRFWALGDSVCERVDLGEHPL